MNVTPGRLNTGRSCAILRISCRVFFCRSKSISSRSTFSPAPDGSLLSSKGQQVGIPTKSPLVFAPKRGSHPSFGSSISMNTPSSAGRTRYVISRISRFQPTIVFFLFTTMLVHIVYFFNPFSSSSSSAGVQVGCCSSIVRYPSTFVAIWYLSSYTISPGSFVYTR